MFGITWSEMAVIAIVALIFIGPKDLPVVLRNFGKWITAARNMAREFQGHVDDLVRESGLDDVRRNLRENTADALKDLADHVDPDRSLREGVDPDKLMAGDAAKDGEKKDVPAVPPPPVPDTAPPSSEELQAFAQSVGESIAPGSAYHPPADVPAVDTAPVQPLPPLPKETSTAAAEPTSAPAKNTGAPEPGRA